MYAINFTTATPRDVIERSIVCHPSTFVERLKAVAHSHGDYAGRTYSLEARRIAEKMCGNIAHAAREIDAGKGVDVIMAEGLATVVPVLQVALELQCVPRSLWGDIAARA